MSIQLDNHEMTIVAEAMREMLLDRLFYGVISRHQSSFRDDMVFITYQKIMSTIVNIFGRTVMQVTPDTVDDKYTQIWVDNMSIAPETWELVNAITLGESWLDVPTHSWHNSHECKVCNDMRSAAVGRCR